MYEVIFYKNKNGENEIKEYLLYLKDKKDKDSKINYNKIISYINMLSKYGFALGNPYIKHIEEEIWELRPVKNRILFAYYKDNIFVILSMFMKQTQKTPKQEIEKAKRYLKDFIKRGGDNGE